MTNPDNVGGLLPCPFCGGESERIDFGVGSGDNEGGSCIACKKCQASGPVEFGYKENFVSNWNRRKLYSASSGDAGGLPELPPSYGDHCVTDSVRTMREPGYTADQMRAYGELCRAAPAGGDSLRALVKELRESLEGVVRVADRNTDEFDRAREAIARASHVFVNAGDSEAQFIADGENLDCPACGGSGHAGDSAPAGSGEVERLKTTIDRYERGLISTPYTRALVDQHSNRATQYYIEVIRLNRVVARQSAKIKRLSALLRKLQQGVE